MPPRIPQLPLSALRICSRSLTITPHAGPSRTLLPALQSLSLHTSAPLNDVARRRGHDPYAAKKAKLRKEKNIARQAELKELRASAAADPVVGRQTSFTDVTDSQPRALPSVDALMENPVTKDAKEEMLRANRLNHFLQPAELESFLEHSKELVFARPALGIPPDPNLVEKEAQIHSHSAEAIRRIVSLGLGSAKDKTRENKQLCINTFGRHVTDETLPKDPLPEGYVPTPKQFEKTPRIGIDTGSSEVQAAILTVKIRALAEHVKNNKKDKTNKRNLRLLCHKRQKILRYLKRKEKGGIRYRNVMEQLGLDDRAIEMELMM